MSNIAQLYPDAKSEDPLEDGREYQDFVGIELAKRGIVLTNFASEKYQKEMGENVQGFEIKLDRKIFLFNRLSIEVAERRRRGNDRPWVDSGILRDDNSWLYLHGNYKVLFIFAKRFLRMYYEKKRPPVEEKNGTIKTFYMPIDVALGRAVKVIEFEPGVLEKASVVSE